MVQLNTLATSTWPQKESLIRSLFMRGGRKSLDSVKPRNNFTKKEDHGLSLGFQVGGTETKVMVADSSKQGEIKLNKDNPDHVIKLENKVDKDDIETLRHIIETISREAVGVSRVVVSLAGFPTQTGKKVGNIQPKANEDGLIYMANKNFASVSDDYTKAKRHSEAQAENRIPYINFLNVAQSAISPHTKLTYIDEAHPSQGLVFEAQEDQKNEIILEIQNDTVSTGESAAAQNPLEGQDSKGIVMGTGFNDSSNRDFDASNASSRKTQNNESGQTKLPKELRLKFDLSFGSDGRAEDKMRAEVFFAGWKDEDNKNPQGIKRTLTNAFDYIRHMENSNGLENAVRTLNEELDKNEIGYHVDPTQAKKDYKELGIRKNGEVKEISPRDISNKELTKMAARAKPNQLVKAITLLKMNQAAKYFVNRDLNDKTLGKKYLKNLRVIGVTGSVIVNTLNKVTGAEEAFLAPFKKYRKDEIILHKHKTGGLDGLESIINAKAALAKTAR